MKTSFKLFPLCIIACAIVFLVTSCKKDEKKKTKEEEPEPPTRTELLMNGEWTITNATTGSLPVWNTPLVDPCYRDNIYTFKTNDTLSVDEGPLKCDEDGEQVLNGVWKLIDDERLYLSAFFLQDTAEIVSISESTIILNSNFMSFDAQITFTKKK
jgi:hypothetical protein